MDRTQKERIKPPPERTQRRRREREPRTSTAPERKARNGTAQKGRQQQRPLGMARGSEARNRSKLPTETRPLERTQNKNRQRRKTAEETAWRTATRQDELEKPKIGHIGQNPTAGHKSPREDPEGGEEKELEGGPRRKKICVPPEKNAERLKQPLATDRAEPIQPKMKEEHETQETDKKGDREEP